MHLPNHNIWKDVDFKKGFKKPLPYIVIILFVLVVFSILYYLDS